MMRLVRVKKVVFWGERFRYGCRITALFQDATLSISQEQCDTTCSKTMRKDPKVVPLRGVHIFCRTDKCTA